MTDQQKIELGIALSDFQEKTGITEFFMICDKEGNTFGCASQAEMKN